MPLTTSVETLLQEFRIAVRTLSKSKVYCATVILMLALGLGATTAVFSVLNILVLRSINVPEPSRLIRYRLVGTIPASEEPPPLADADFPLSGPMFESVRARQGVCTDLFAWATYNTFNIRERQHPELARMRGALVSGSTFRILGINAVMGRALDVQDDSKTAQEWAANLSYSLWKDSYNGDPSVVGRVIFVNDRAVRVVGILPADFDGVMSGAHPGIFMPLAFAEYLPGLIGRYRNQGNLWLTTMGRLKPGVTLRQAEANLRVIQPQVMEDSVAPALRKWEFISALHLEVGSGRTGSSDYRFEYQNPLIMAQVLAILVLGLVCVDLSSLIGARTISRYGEFALRRGLGAGTGRMMRQFIVEQSILAALGGIAGTVFARWAAPILLSYISPGDRPQVDLTPSLSVYLTVTSCAALSVVTSTLFPALRASRFNLQDALRAGGRPASGISSGRTIIAWWLFPVQVAVSVALVVAASLFSASLGRLVAGHSGLRSAGVLIFQTDIDRRPERGERLAGLYSRMLDRIKRTPGVQAASIALVLPMQRGFVFHQDFLAQDGAGKVREDRELAANRVSAGFFDTLGIRLLQGRDFTLSDDDRSQSVCIVNRLAADYFFPRGDAMGGFMRTANGRVECRIVGIVENAKYDTLHERPPRTVYLPYTQHSTNLGSLYFCVYGLDPKALKSAYTLAFEEFIPDTLLLLPRSLGEQMANSVSTERMTATLSGFLGLLALLLTSITLYGLVSWTTSRRTSEIGIRMALGASELGVLRLILRQSMVPVLVGVIVGTFGALVTSPSLSSLLYETQARDPLLVGGGGGGVLLVAAIAAFIPARRAVRIQPAAALRNE